jgi:hypothetical protein
MLRRVALVKTDVSEEILFLRSVLRLLVTANCILSSPILFVLIMEAIRSFETSVLTRATRSNIPEDGVLSACNLVSLWDHFLCHLPIKVPTAAGLSP